MRRFIVITLLVFVATAPLAADVFTVTLTSGSTFITRYQPHQSETQEDKVLLMTEFGNWISLPKNSIVSVASDTESKGFGTVLDSQTIALGWIPPSMGGSTDAAASQGDLDPTTRMINFMREQNAPAPVENYTNQLTVEPSQSTGIPVGIIDRSNPFSTSSGRNR